jgi:hypothetical protein
MWKLGFRKPRLGIAFGPEQPAASNKLLKKIASYTSILCHMKLLPACEGLAVFIMCLHVLDINPNPGLGINWVRIMSSANFMKL